MHAHPPKTPTSIRVWDLPTRLFHWGLAVSIVGAVVTANLGSDAMPWHFRFGYAVLTLLLFRVVWGWAGPHYARFASFPPRPGAALRALRDPHSVAGLGHSPAAALSVYALLIVSAIQVTTGLFSNDAIIWEGPLRNWVSSETSDRITGWHLTNRFILIALIALHLIAIIWYRWRHGKNLTKAMISGDAEAPSESAPESRDDLTLRIRAALILAACAALVGWLVR